MFARGGDFPANKSSAAVDSFLSSNFSEFLCPADEIAVRSLRYPPALAGVSSFAPVSPNALPVAPKAQNAAAEGRGPETRYTVSVLGDLGRNVPFVRTF